MATLIGESPLSIREFFMAEPHPLGTLHDAVLEFLQDRDDVAVYGAQAVNAHVDRSRMTEDVDVASTRAREFAEELRAHLADRFHIAVRVREVREGIGFRVYQLRRPENRHLVDVRSVSRLPECERRQRILVVTAPELIAEKVIAYTARRHQPKGGTDWRDLAQLLLTYPELKSPDGLVRSRLTALNAGEEALRTWGELANQRIESEDDESEFDW